MHRGCFVWTATPPLSGRRTPSPRPRVCLLAVVFLHVSVVAVACPGSVLAGSGGPASCVGVVALARLGGVPARWGKTASRSLSCAPNCCCCRSGYLVGPSGLCVPFLCLIPPPPLCPTFRCFWPWVPCPSAFCGCPPALSFLFFFFFFPLPAPPLSPLFLCVRRWVLWVSALCGCPPPPPRPFVFFAPSLFAGSRPVVLCLRTVWLGFFFLPRVAATVRVVCALCAGAVPHLLRRLLLVFCGVPPLVVWCPGLVCAFFCGSLFCSVLCCTGWCAVVLCCWFCCLPSPVGVSCAVAVDLVLCPAVSCCFVPCFVVCGALVCCCVLWCLLCCCVVSWCAVSSGCLVRCV